MSAARPYRDRTLAVEPIGIEVVAVDERHGSPRDLFGVWFSANAEIATWMVGVFAVALYGADPRWAALGIVAGNVAGYALLGVLATFGPRYGVPQMVASRLAFGTRGNVAPATLSFLAGVGWFAVNTIFGAYALETLTGATYAVSLALILALQTLIAVFGYNLIHRFQQVSAWLLGAGFTVLGIATFARTAHYTGLHPHAAPFGHGALAGLLMGSALAFAYATGWLPCASDYSRYLDPATPAREIWRYTFLGSALPCIVLEIMGALAASTAHANLVSGTPTDAISAVLGGRTLASAIVLASIVLGTITANCMNLYSGALAALVAFGIRLPRWSVAAAVGILGAVLSLGGGDPRATAERYSDFLLLLSYWAAPWAAVVLVTWWHERNTPADLARVPAWRAGILAWLAGILASLPFWNQAWYVGPVPRAWPQIGDLSYDVGFAVATLAMLLFERMKPAASSEGIVA